jgi:hypothetical protein
MDTCGYLDSDDKYIQSYQNLTKVDTQIQS